MTKKLFSSLTSLNSGLQVVIYGQFFINLGYYSLFPFISLYLIQLGMSPAVIGGILAFRSGSNIVGMLLGGALSDRFGSKRTMNYALALSSIGYLTLIWANDAMTFSLSFIIVGLFTGIAYPAESKIIIDNTNDRNRSDAYSMIRTVMNLAAAIAPLIGVSVFLKWPAISYITIAMIQIVYVISVKYMISEKQLEKRTSAQVNILSAFTEYSLVFKDTRFIYTLVALTCSSVAYYVIETTLPMFLDQRMENAGYLYTSLLMINTYMVIFLQIFITKRGNRFSDRIAASIGQYIYVLALVMLAFSNKTWITVAAVILFTFGEMLIASPAFVLLTRVVHEGAVGKYQAIARLRLAVAQPISSLVGGVALQFGGSTIMMLSYAAFAFIGAMMMTRKRDVIRTDVISMEEKA